MSKSNPFRDNKACRFHNDNILSVQDPRIDCRDSIKTDRVLDNIDGEYRIIIAGDALMAVMG